MTYTLEHCIVDMISASGPQEAYALKRECQDQCKGYTSKAFEAALSWLCSEGTIVGEVCSEDSKPTLSYDFPAN
jgi:hypothetical protein